VALSHRAVFNQLNAYAPAIHLSDSDVIVSWLPLYHDMGLIASFLLPVLLRVPLVLMSPFDWVRAPAKLMQLVSKYKGTLTWLPNFAYNFCATRVRDRDMESVDLSSWRAVINCSEPVYGSSHMAFLNKFARWGFKESALAACYAMAENTFAVTQTELGKPIAHNEGGGIGNAGQVSSGKPLPNVQLRILDADRNDLPENTIGEIALKSDCMLTGYYNRPDATAQAFHEGWYLTGDLGYLLNGELYVTGRKKDLIIVGGKNVYPQDLEQLTGEVEGVRAGRVAAFGVFNENAGTEDVVIVAEAESEEESIREGVAEAVRMHVTRNSDVAVRQVVLVDSRWLIKTSSGKVARGANREKYLKEMTG
jgi:acyl-CoA synthetase (AMP-forming)/AMP-acid ligase II